MRVQIRYHKILRTLSRFNTNAIIFLLFSILTEDKLQCNSLARRWTGSGSVHGGAAVGRVSHFV